VTTKKHKSLKQIGKIDFNINLIASISFTFSINITNNFLSRAYQENVELSVCRKKVANPFLLSLNALLFSLNDEVQFILSRTTVSNIKVGLLVNNQILITISIYAMGFK
ncbi:hypothetical protein EWO26_21655, partial [Salmonella enterica]|nr:hypothetical protein [Salmonella enterica]